MKKILIRIVVLMLVFAAAVFGTSKILGKKMADTSEVMAQATFPLVYVDLNGKQITHINDMGKWQYSVPEETECHCHAGYTDTAQ